VIAAASKKELASMTLGKSCSKTTQRYIFLA